MKLSEFKEKGYQIKENAFVSQLVFLIDLDGLENLDDSTELTGEIEEAYYDDAPSEYGVFDADDNIVGSNLSFSELQEFIQKLN